MLGVTPNVHADDDKAILSRLVAELEAVSLLIQDAENAPKAQGSRLNFNYGALKADLDLMKTGIRQYIDSQNTLPRTAPIKPLNGTYSQ